MDPSCLTTSQYITFSSTSDNVKIGKDDDEFTLSGSLDTSEIMYRNMVAMQPNSVSITNLFYNVTTDNNILIVAEKKPFTSTNGDPPPSTGTPPPTNTWSSNAYKIRILEFPIGSYTGIGLVKTLNDLLDYTYYVGTTPSKEIFGFSSTTRRIYRDKSKFPTDMSTQITFSFVYYLPANNGNKAWSSTIWDTLGFDSASIDEKINTLISTSAPITENPATLNFFTMTPDQSKTKTTWIDNNLTLIPFTTWYKGKHFAIDLPNMSALPIIYQGTSSFVKLMLTDVEAVNNTQIDSIRVGDYFKITKAVVKNLLTLISTPILDSTSYPYEDVIGHTWKIAAFDDFLYKLSVGEPFSTRKLQFILHKNDTELTWISPNEQDYIIVTEFEIYRGKIEFPVDFEITKEQYLIDEDAFVSTKVFAPQPVNLLGPECVFISISGVHSNHLSISNVSTYVGVKRKSFEPVENGYDNNRKRKDDIHKWLTIPVNAAYGEIIHRTFDDTWANSLQFFNRVPIDQTWVIKMYDHQMNLLHLAPNQTLSLAFKKFDSVL